MPSVSFLFLLLSLTYAPHLLFSTTTNGSGRRILHQPFVPQDAIPPSQPPSPSPPSPPSTTTSASTSTTPKVPFDTSTTPPNNSPFFPTYPSPPPPPAPATFASFPANISSLILPHSSRPKRSSPKLLIAAISAVISAAIVGAVLLCFYYRRHKQNQRAYADEKTHSSSYRSDNNIVYATTNAESRRNISTRNNSTTRKLSSEFLYLGTVVNSRGGVDGDDRRNDDDEDTGSEDDPLEFDRRKLDSPELQPLPPLNFRQNSVNVAVATNGNEEQETEEEFYSPRGSLGGRESSVGTGSGSRRLFAGIAGDSERRNSSTNESSSCSCSSSSSGSPARSKSVSISPPVSVVSPPRISDPKSPELTQVQVPARNVMMSFVSSSPDMTTVEASPARVSDAWYRNVKSPPLSLASTSPDRNVNVIKDPDVDSLNVLKWNHVKSPTLSSVSVSPERGLDKDHVESPTLSSVSVSTERDLEKDHVKSPTLSSAFASPETGLEKNHVQSPLSSVSVSPERDLEKDHVKSPTLSSAFASPERGLEKNHVQSPTLSSVSVSPDRDLEKDHVKSHTLSSAFASPERGLEKNRVQSPTLSLASMSPERDLEKHHAKSPTLSSVSMSPERDLEKHNVKSSTLSSASVSPGRDLEKDLVKSPNLSSASISPERDLHHKSASQSPRLSNVSLHHGRRSPSAHSSSSSSPERKRSLKNGSSPRISDVSDKELQSPVKISSPVAAPPPPAPRPPRRQWEIPNRGSSVSSSSSASPEREKSSKDASPYRMPEVSDQTLLSPVNTSCPISAPPPPPPPPPPPSHVPRQRRQWEIPNPNPPTSIDQLPISQPPPLMPPSRPFVIQSTNKVSPTELPPSSTFVDNVEEETSKPKLKPLHWDKVRASSDREMVWDHLRSSSFKLNEEMIETLFVVNTPTLKPAQTTPRLVVPSTSQENRVLDPKKSQNIAILLRALNVTIEEVCEALLEGNADMLGTELLESLLKMAPTKEEECKLKEYKDESPTKLGPAEKFLKAVLDVPFAFKRVDAMLYMANFDSEIEYLKRSFETLEASCEELRNSRMFLKLLEAVLKTGNRMNVGTNRGDAQAFKLDTLLKLVDVKGADGKTTLLHFVVQEIIRTEGARLSSSSQNPNSTLNEDAKCRKLGLQVVSGLSSELTDVKKAAAMDSDILSSEVAKLSKGIENISEVVRLNETMGLDESSQKFSESMNRFMRKAEEEIIRIQAQESVAMSLVKEITEYFHGNSAKEEAHPFRIFMVVRDFLNVLDRVCKEVGMINERTIVSSAHKFPVPVNPMMPQSFPVPVNPTAPQGFSGFQGRQHYSSSDDES